jgi:hypothetical protein
MTTERTRNIRRVVSALAILATVAVLYGIYYLFFLPLPSPLGPGDIYRPNQGWDDESRRWYYSSSQGTLVIPYDWFIALEQPDSRQSIIADDYVTRFRLIPNPDPQFNPDYLPVGVTKATHPVDGRAWVSFTCAMCHTGQINYRGMSMRIDGGPAQQDFNAYTQAMIKSLALTRFIPTRFYRFAKRVLKENYTASSAATLWSDLKGFIKSNGSRILQQQHNKIYPTASGFGRVDALGTGANGMMYQLNPKNEVPSNAPVSNPPLWWTHDYDWVQSVAAIEQPLGRNMVEAMGVNAYVDLTGGAGNIAPIGITQVPGSKPQELYLSSVEMRNMYLMERMLSALQPPEWPEQILGKVDRARAERGRLLYEEAVFQNALSPQEEQLFPDPDETAPRRGLCARCHGPTLTPPNEYKRRYIRLKMYKLAVIGTSGFDAINFNARKPLLSGILQKQLGKDQLGIGEALQTFSDGVQQRRWAELWKKQGFLFFPGDSMADIPLYQGFRPNRFRAPLGYPARPMGGYWATAPFLHNGSVPNLYQLLGPANERPAKFYTGNLEFDPIHVGYVSEKFRGGFQFDTRTDGNGNGGHEFRDAAKGTPGVIGPALTRDQRLDIIEYMKVINDFPSGYLGDEEKKARQEGVRSWHQGYQQYPRANATSESEKAARHVYE